MRPYRSTWRFVAASCVLLVASVSSGTARAESLTLAQAITMAKRSAPSLAVARKRVGVSEAGFASANRLVRYNPTLQLGFDTDAPFDGEGDRTITVGLAQTVELGGQQGLRREVATAESANAKADVRRSQNDVVTDVALTYYAVDTAVRQVAVEREMAEIYRKLVTSGRLLFERGAITRLDLVSLELEHARVEAQVARDSAVAESLERDLAGQLGRPDMRIQPMTADQPELDVPPLEAELARAVASRPELAAARARQQSASAQRTLASRELWLSPTFGVGLRADRVVHGRNGFRFTGAGVPDLLGVDNAFNILTFDLSLPLPIFEQRNADRARATAAIDVATAEERASGTLIETEVRSASARAAGAARALEIQQKVLPTFDEASRLYESAFARGATTVTETLLGEERVLRSKLNHLSLRGEYLRARAILDRAAGMWAAL